MLCSRLHQYLIWNKGIVEYLLHFETEYIDFTILLAYTVMTNVLLYNDIRIVIFTDYLTCFFSINVTGFVFAYKTRRLHKLHLSVDQY